MGNQINLLVNNFPAFRSHINPARSGIKPLRLGIS